MTLSLNQLQIEKISNLGKRRTHHCVRMQELRANADYSEAFVRFTFHDKRRIEDSARGETKLGQRLHQALLDHHAAELAEVDAELEALGVRISA